MTKKKFKTGPMVALGKHVSEFSDKYKSEHFLDRELQWLEFNDRVLHEAEDDRVPPLERLRFLIIASKNLDEFFMKRVGGFYQTLQRVPAATALKGRDMNDHIKEVRGLSKKFYERRDQCLKKQIYPLLEHEGISVVKLGDLSDKESRRATEYFSAVIFPVLTPIAVDMGHPFPFISNLSLSLGIHLRYPGENEDHFARVKIPQNFSQMFPVSKDGKNLRLLPLRELIRGHLEELFPGMTVAGETAFRVTRNLEIEMEEKQAEDLAEVIEEQLRRRRFAEIVRLECEKDKDPWISDFLMDELDIEKSQIFEVPGEVDFNSMQEIADLALPHLKYPPFKAAVPLSFNEEQSNLFQIIRQKDLLVQHPYESFAASTEKFIQHAVRDPKVIAIKMTLYRMGRETPFGPLLIWAAESGKQVVCLVELQARLDEDKNLFWAEKLEDAGVHVVYGVEGLKTHAKTVLVIRQEGRGVRCYAHVGTGNYHHVTARTYEDFGLFTSDTRVTSELVQLFHYLTGRALKQTYHHLLVAPINMMDGLISRIRQEIKHSKAGRKARIIMKCNAIQDPQIIEWLYEASQAGVQVDLIVRGICCLRPGIQGLSDNIRVISILGRFLEHSRVYYFSSGEDDPLKGEFFIGSADLMTRNLRGRVEVCAPLFEEALRSRIWDILQTLLKDRRQAWDMNSDGSFKQRKPKSDKESIGCHELLAKAAAPVRPVLKSKDE